MSIVIYLSSILVLVGARQGFGPGEQDWGYVTVRPGAHMFWWLYYTTADVKQFTDRPLIMWLQGGPGASATGYGNFAELGPLDVDLKPRNHTWVKNANVLFVDNPVGAGWSYAENISSLATTNNQIANDMVKLLQEFYNQFPKFKKVPLYIVGQSYGGKMAIEIGLVLDKAIKEGTIKSNLMGVGLGNSWISPIDSVLTWADYLFNIGGIDQQGYDKVTAIAKITKEAVEDGKFVEATARWLQTEITIFQHAHNINFYNVLQKVETTPYTKLKNLANPSNKDDDVKIEKIMKAAVKKVLGLNKTFGLQITPTFEKLSGDFMKPVTDIVERVLNETSLRVVVFSGQLDLIVDTPGTVHWVDNLKWISSKKWDTTERKVVSVDNVNEGYVKTLGQLSLYWVNRAGHMVPSDNPAAMDAILRDLTNNYDGKAKRKE